jgi:chaperonin GroES
MRTEIVKCGIRPLQDRVILVKPKADELLESGVIVPAIFDDAEEYEVVAVGPGRYGNDGIQIPVSVRVGEHVLVNKHQVQPIRLPNDPTDYYATRDEPGSIRAVL